MKPADLKVVMKKFAERKFPLVLSGSPGIGKTEMVKQVAKEIGHDLIITHPVIGDPTDYKGFPHVCVNNDGKPDRAEFIPFDDLYALMHVKKDTIFFIDDMGQATSTVQAALMQLVLGRQVNGKNVSDKVVFFAATNRREDKSGVSRILEALKSRFVSIVEVEADVEQWVEWAIENRVDPTVIAFIRFRPNLLNDFEPTANLENSPVPRTVNNVSKILSLNIDDEYVTGELIKGAAGEGFRVEFMQFMKMAKRLPNITSILMDPSGADVPEEVDILYALTGAIASQVTLNNIDAVLQYAGRIPPEFSVKMAKDCKLYEPKIQMTDAFITWCEEHHKYML